MAYIMVCIVQKSLYLLYSTAYPNIDHRGPGAYPSNIWAHTQTIGNLETQITYRNMMKTL